MICVLFKNNNNNNSVSSFGMGEVYVTGKENDLVHTFGSC